MNLYTENGWLDYEKIYSMKSTFIFIVGARGIGKTYGGVKYLYDQHIPFLFTRRTQSQASMASNPLTSDIVKPIKAEDIDNTFVCEKLSKTVDGLYLQIGEEVASKPFAFVTSISTGSNLRGFNGDAIECIFFDEFIAQPEERPIKEEATAFLNLYETVNRNREILGKPPVKVICAANSFNLANPIFMKLRLVEKAEKMRKKHTEVYTDSKRGYTIIQPLGSPISGEKKNTSLYKLVGENEEFSQMAIGNTYLDDFSENIKSRPLQEFRPLVTIGEITIYKHKSDTSYYVALHCSGSPKETFTTSKSDGARFKKAYHYLWTAFLSRKVFFESYLAQVMFDKAFTL